jgi:hypothetical protein
LNPFYIALKLSALSTRIQQELDDEDDEKMISDDPSGLISVLETLRNRYEKLRRAIDLPILSEHCEKLKFLLQNMYQLHHKLSKSFFSITNIDYLRFVIN